MLRLAFLFLLISLVSGLFGFGGAAGAAAELAKASFYLSLGVFCLTLFLGYSIGNRLRQR